MAPLFERADIKQLEKHASTGAEPGHRTQEGRKASSSCLDAAATNKQAVVVRSRAVGSGAAVDFGLEIQLGKTTMTLVVVVVGGGTTRILPLINWIIVASQCVKGLFKANSGI